jgi:hypothetical protein
MHCDVFGSHLGHDDNCGLWSFHGIPEFLQASKDVTTLEHGRFLPYPSQIIVHHSAYLSTLCILRCWLCDRINCQNKILPSLVGRYHAIYTLKIEIILYNVRVLDQFWTPVVQCYRVPDCFWSPIVRVSPLKTPFRLLIGLLQSQSHVTTIIHKYLLRCYAFTQL